MKKTEQIYGVKTTYITEGEGPDMILLHGWGQNKEMMQAIFDHYKDRYRVFAIDFPGFGESENRVAIRYAAKNPENVKKMCLTGAAGIRPKQSLESKMRVKVFKVGKWFLKLTGQTKKLEELQKNAGSEDYRNAQGIMRPTFVKVVNDDVTELLPLVKCPVLLVWGDLDTAAPLWMGKQMEKMMPDAGLAIFAGDDHWAYWHQADRFNRVLDIFLKETA